MLLDLASDGIAPGSLTGTPCDNEELLAVGVYVAEGDGPFRHRPPPAVVGDEGKADHLQHTDTGTRARAFYRAREKRFVA